MSIGYMSTHISRRPFEKKIQYNIQSNTCLLILCKVALSYLFDARFVRVQQGSGLHVLGDELAANPGYLLPVVQHSQGQMLLSLLFKA